MDTPRQNIDVNRLESYGIYELRNLARALGVSRPTTLLREDLITQIKSRMRSDEAFPSPSKRGRPPRSKGFNIANVLEPEPLYENILEAPDFFQNTFCVRSPSPCVEQSRTGSGYLHTVPRGHGVIISSCLNTYHVPLKLIAAHQLETGDHMELKSVWNEYEKRYVVQEVKNIKRMNFDTAPSVRPKSAIKVNDFEFKLGNRVVLCVKKTFDCVENIVNYHKQLKPDFYKIALLAEEGDDSCKYLREQGIDEVYLAKVDFSVKKKIMLALTSLFNAKHNVVKGKNVIFFINDLNRLFNLYNASAYEKGIINTTQVNLGPLTDLKTFFMSARDLETAGSLTIIAHAAQPSTDVEKYIVEEFINIANVFHAI